MTAKQSQFLSTKSSFEKLCSSDVNSKRLLCKMIVLKQSGIQNTLICILFSYFSYINNFCSVRINVSSFHIKI